MATVESILVTKQGHCPKCGHGPAGMYRDQSSEEWACRLCGWRSGARSSAVLTRDPIWPHQLQTADSH